MLKIIAGLLFIFFIAALLSIKYGFWAGVGIVVAPIAINYVLIKISRDYDAKSSSLLKDTLQ